MVSASEIRSARVRIRARASGYDESCHSSGERAPACVIPALAMQVEPSIGSPAGPTGAVLSCVSSIVA